MREIYMIVCNKDQYTDEPFTNILDSLEVRKVDLSEVQDILFQEFYPDTPVEILREKHSYKWVEIELIALGCSSCPMAFDDERIKRFIFIDKEYKSDVNTHMYINVRKYLDAHLRNETINRIIE